MDRITQAVQSMTLGLTGGPVHDPWHGRRSSSRLVDWTDRLLGTLAMFRYPTMPIEWLMNHWNHTKDTLIMLSHEPDRPQNKFEDGKKFYYNTGFMILKNTPRTHEIFDAWMACPDDKERFLGCHEYTYRFSHEQVALAKYVREMEFNRSTDIVGVPCNEANGSPYTVESEGCAGKLICHLWMYGKEKQGFELIDDVMRYFVPILHDSFMQGIQRSYVDQNRNETM